MCILLAAWEAGWGTQVVQEWKRWKGVQDLDMTYWRDRRKKVSFAVPHMRNAWRHASKFMRVANCVRAPCQCGRIWSAGSSRHPPA